MIYFFDTWPPTQLSSFSIDMNKGHGRGYGLDIASERGYELDMLVSVDIIWMMTFHIQPSLCRSRLYRLTMSFLPLPRKTFDKTFDIFGLILQTCPHFNHKLSFLFYIITISHPSFLLEVMLALEIVVGKNRRMTAGLNRLWTALPQA
jgi:hypothetical protein